MLPCPCLSMSLGKWHPKVRSTSSNVSAVKSIRHDTVWTDALVPVLDRRWHSCSALTDHDLKAEVRRNRSLPCDVDQGRRLLRCQSNVVGFGKPSSKGADHTQ